MTEKTKKTQKKLADALEVLKKSVKAFETANANLQSALTNHEVGAAADVEDSAGDAPDCTTEELALAAAQGVAATAQLAETAAAAVHQAASNVLMTANDYVTAASQALADCRNG